MTFYDSTLPSLASQIRNHASWYCLLIITYRSLRVHIGNKILNGIKFAVIKFLREREWVCVCDAADKNAARTVVLWDTASRQKGFISWQKNSGKATEIVDSYQCHRSQLSHHLYHPSSGLDIWLCIQIICRYSFWEYYPRIRSMVCLFNYLMLFINA